MAQFQMHVFTNALDGRDDEFNDWYDNTHLGEVLAVPGVTGAVRVDVTSADGSVPAHRYLAIYDLEAEDPATVGAEIGARAADGRLKLTDAMSPDALTAFYPVRTPYRTA